MIRGSAQHGKIFAARFLYFINCGEKIGKDVLFVSLVIHNRVKLIIKKDDAPEASIFDDRPVIFQILLEIVFERNAGRLFVGRFLIERIRNANAFWLEIRDAAFILFLNQVTLGKSLLCARALCFPNLSCGQGSSLLFSANSKQDL